VHRDAISGEGYAMQPVAEINGKKAAQIMIISGCDDGTMGMPNYMQNFHFACLLQQQMETDYPTLTRPILFDYRKYNQDLTTGSLLIEVGSHGNTLEQAAYAGELFGKSLARVLKELH
jgi:stage II sporulation protein P